MSGSGLQLAQNATIIKFGVMDLCKDSLMASTPFSC